VIYYCPGDEICCTPGDPASKCCPADHPLCVPKENPEFCCRQRDIQNYAENIVVGPTAFAATKKIAAKMKPSVVGSSAAKRIAFAVMEKTAARPKKHAVVNSVARPVCFVAIVKDVA